MRIGLFLFFISFSLISNARETIDLSKFYRSRLYESGNAPTILQERVGFIVQKNPTIPSSRNLILNLRTPPVPSPVPAARKPTNPSSSPTQTPGTTTTNTPKGTTSPNGLTPMAPFNSAAAGGKGPAAVAAPLTTAGGANGPRVVNGVPISDDDSAGNEKINEIRAGSGNMAHKMPVPSAASLNAQNASDDGGGSGGAAMASLGGGGGLKPLGPGDFEAGGGAAPAKGGFDNALSELKKLASNMLGGTFGDLGGGNLNGGDPFATGGVGRGTKLSSGKRAGVGSNEVDVAGAFDRNFRGIASQLEFNSPSTWMFGNMCEHWARLARKERLGINQVKCPK